MRAGAGRGPDREGRRRRATPSPTSPAPTAACSVSSGSTGWSRSTSDAGDGHRRGRHPAVEAERGAGPARVSRWPTSATSTARRSRARSPPRPTAAAPASAAWRRSCRELELVTADGEVLRCSADEEPEVFACARVGLGALGVVTKVTLQCVPAFRLHSVERPTTLDQMLADFDDDRRRQRAHRLLLVPAHRRRHGQGRQPHRRAGPAQVAVEDVARRGPARRTTSSARCAAVGRDAAGRGARRSCAARAAAGQDRDRRREPPGAVQPAARAFRRDGVRDPACRHRRRRCCGVRDLIEGEGLRVDFPIELRVAAADDIPLSTAHGRETALPRGAPVGGTRRSSRTSAASRRSWTTSAAGRTGGRCTIQRAATLAPRVPGVGPVPGGPRAPRPRGAVPQRVPRPRARPGGLTSASRGTRAGGEGAHAVPGT